MASVEHPSHPSFQRVERGREDFRPVSDAPGPSGPRAKSVRPRRRTPPLHCRKDWTPPKACALPRVRGTRVRESLIWKHSNGYIIIADQTLRYCGRDLERRPLGGTESSHPACPRAPLWQPWGMCSGRRADEALGNLTESGPDMTGTGECRGRKVRFRVQPSRPAQLPDRPHFCRTGSGSARVADQAGEDDCAVSEQGAETAG